MKTKKKFSHWRVDQFLGMVAILVTPFGVGFFDWDATEGMFVLLLGIGILLLTITKQLEQLIKK